MKKQLLLLVMTLLPMVAMADPVEIDGIYYNLVSKAKQAEVTSKPSGKYFGSVNIPSVVSYNGEEYSVTSIGEKAFYNCSGLTSVTIPNSVTSIGDRAFAYCSSLTSVHIIDIAAWCNISFGDYYSNPLSYAHHLYMNGSEITDLVIPNSVTSIGNRAFSGCSGLTSVNIPNSVTSIGDAAFQDCSGLTSITIPNSVTSIGSYAFDNCSGLTSVHITDIEAWCNISFGSGNSNPLYYAHHLYMNGSEITDLVIPNSVTSIGYWAFSGCSGLTSVTIGNSVTSIGDYAFSGCTGLTSVTIGNSVTSIGNSAFYGCSGLTSVTIPNSVTSIGYEAFYNCTSLTSVTIGSGIKSIGSSAFANCKNLEDVYCYAESVPQTNADAFYGSYIDYATLHVPDASVNAYKQAEPWKNFKAIVGIEGGGTPDPQKCEKPTISYKNGQLMFASATEGVEFISEITDNDIKKYYEATVTLTVTYNISVYATKTGYDNSDVAYATLCWIDVDPKTEGITDGVAQVPSQAVLIQSEGGILTVRGIDDGTQVSIYGIDGTEAGSAIGRNGEALIGTNLKPGSVAIVKIGKKSVKVITR